MKIVIPQKPISWNKYYSGIHWTKRLEISKEWKWLVKMALLKAKVPRIAYQKPVQLKIRAYMRRLIDCDNICLKVIIDGLKDWNLILDDNPAYVKEIRIQVMKDKNERIEIEIL